MQTSEFKQDEAGLAKKGFDRVWRGNKAGTIRATTYPDFYYKTDEESLLRKREWIKVGTNTTGWLAPACQPPYTV